MKPSWQQCLRYWQNGRGGSGLTLPFLSYLSDSAPGQVLCEMTVYSGTVFASFCTTIHAPVFRLSPVQSHLLLDEENSPPMFIKDRNLLLNNCHMKVYFDPTQDSDLTEFGVFTRIRTDVWAPIKDCVIQLLTNEAEWLLSKGCYSREFGRNEGIWLEKNGLPEPDFTDSGDTPNKTGYVWSNLRHERIVSFTAAAMEYVRR